MKTSNFCKCKSFTKREIYNGRKRHTNKSFLFSVHEYIITKIERKMLPYIWKQRAFVQMHELIKTRLNYYNIVYYYYSATWKKLLWLWMQTIMRAVDLLSNMPSRSKVLLSCKTACVCIQYCHLSLLTVTKAISRRCNKFSSLTAWSAEAECNLCKPNRRESIGFSSALCFHTSQEAQAATSINDALLLPFPASRFIPLLSHQSPHFVLQWQDESRHREIIYFTAFPMSTAVQFVKESVVRLFFLLSGFYVHYSQWSWCYFLFCSKASFYSYDLDLWNQVWPDCVGFCDGSSHLPCSVLFWSIIHRGSIT